jgi:hypothetical protein
MKWQTNEPLGPFINEWGCFLHFLLEKVEKSTGWTKHFSNEDIVNLYVACMRKTFVYKDGTTKPWISPEVWKNGKPADGCFVWNAKGVYNAAAEFLGSDYRCVKYVGWKNKNYIPQKNEEEGLCLKRQGYSGVHFVAGTGIASIPWQKEIEFDPVEGGSLCAKYGWIDSKRILVIKAA